MPSMIATVARSHVTTVESAGGGGAACSRARVDAPVLLVRPQGPDVRRRCSGTRNMFNKMCWQIAA